MGAHEAAVARIATAVRAFYACREPFRIYHGSTNSTRPAHGDRVVDISDLSRVVDIDTESRVAVVEPNVPMDRLIEATLRHGLVPPVVPEFPGITVGGGYSGSAGESSSFRHGYFDESVNAVEMVLANGDVVTASRTERPDLFKGAAGAAGTLGITTKLELRLLPAKRFVKTTYHRRTSVPDTIHALRRETHDPANDYVDGILFSDSCGVVITGQMTDDMPVSAVPRTFSGAWDPWYFLHVKQMAHSLPSPSSSSSSPSSSSSSSSSSSTVAEYVPLAEYLFRYDRGGFWVGVEAFRYFGVVPFNRWTRWFLDDFMHTRMMYRAMHASNSSFGYMVQDLSLPYSTASDFVDYVSRELDIWPLWLCPLREIEPPTFHPSTSLPGPDASPKPMLNIGLWGRLPGDMGAFVRKNRLLEDRLTALGGRKVLYSHTYYTEPEFWKLYDQKWYDGLRRKYSATTLPTVYDKVRVKLTADEDRRGLSWMQRIMYKWPFAGLVGIYHAIRSKDYMLHRNAAWTYSKGGHPR